MLDKLGGSRSTRPRRPQVHWHDGGSGPAVLLLNGLMLSGLVWPRDLLSRLERRFRVSVMADTAEAFGAVQHPGQRRAQLLIVFNDRNGDRHRVSREC